MAIGCGRVDLSVFCFSSVCFFRLLCSLFTSPTLQQLVS